MHHPPPRARSEPPRTIPCELRFTAHGLATARFARAASCDTVRDHLPSSAWAWAQVEEPTHAAHEPAAHESSRSSSVLVGAGEAIGRGVVSAPPTTHAHGTLSPTARMPRSPHARSTPARPHACLLARTQARTHSATRDPHGAPAVGVRLTGHIRRCGCGCSCSSRPRSRACARLLLLAVLG